VAVALLVVRLVTRLVALAVAVSAILVPEAVLAFTCRTSVKLALAFTARLLLSVHVTVPVPEHAHPDATIDTKVMFGGTVWVNVGEVAAAGPLFVTVCV